MSVTIDLNIYTSIRTQNAQQNAQTDRKAHTPRHRYKSTCFTGTKVLALLVQKYKYCRKLASCCSGRRKRERAHTDSRLKRKRAIDTESRTRRESERTDTESRKRERSTQSLGRERAIDTESRKRARSAHTHRHLGRGSERKHTGSYVESERARS